MHIQMDVTARVGPCRTLEFGCGFYHQPTNGIIHQINVYLQTNTFEGHFWTPCSSHVTWFNWQYAVFLNKIWHMMVFPCANVSTRRVTRGDGIYVGRAQKLEPPWMINRAPSHITGGELLVQKDTHPAGRWSFTSYLNHWCSQTPDRIDLWLFYSILSAS